jgi:hypothetical protein
MKTTVLLVRNCVLVFFFTICFTPLFSQSITTGNGKFEIGLGIGPSFFLGDLGGTHGEGRTFIKDVNIPLTKLSKGLYVSYYPADWLGFRLAANQSMLEGHDSVIKDKGGAERFRKERNLNFESNVMEAYIAAEVYPTVFLEQYEGFKGKIRPYGVIGIGMFHFNPKAQYTDPAGNSRMVALQPLRLEGQGMEEYPDRKMYKLTQIEIPMGFGAKYFIKENMYVGFEVLHRKTFTDYMDDVSTNYIDAINFDKYLTAPEATIARQLYYRENQINPATRPYLNEQRGDPKENDSFFSTILRFGWRLNNISPASRQMRCPKFY